VTEGALVCWGFRSRLRIWQRMMPKSEKAPAIGFGEPLTVLDGYIEAVVLTVKKPTSRRFLTRAIWKRRIKNSSEFFYNHRAFGKRTRLQVCIDVFFLDVHMMVFGEIRLSVVESVGR
jgi:hypothetical protein